MILYHLKNGTIPALKCIMEYNHYLFKFFKLLLMQAAAAATWQATQLPRITELNICVIQTARTENSQKNILGTFSGMFVDQIIIFKFCIISKICSFTEVNVNYVK